MIATRGLLAATTLAALFLPHPAAPQEDEALGSFLAQLADAGRRFEDVGAAVTEGYRKLGPDFPGMGEHWIHPGLVIAGELDPGRPPVIGYTVVDGRRHLISFAYTRVLGPRDALPVGPFPAEAWHDHTGGVDEESLLLSGPATVHPEEDGFRLSMVHVWSVAENPDGMLAQNNWALPFIRGGLPSPEHASSEAARALSLSTDSGIAFYDELLREGVELERSELEIANAAFDDAAQASRRLQERMSQAGQVTRADVLALEEVWDALWERLDREISSRSLRDMAPLRS